MNLSILFYSPNDPSLSGCKYRTLFPVAQLLLRKIFFRKFYSAKPLILKPEFLKNFSFHRKKSGKEIPDQAKADDKIAIRISGSRIKGVPCKGGIEVLRL